MKYRNNLMITASILDASMIAGRGGIAITPLLHKSNLPHPRLTKFLDNLTSNGLINQIKQDGKNTFVITEKGILYLQEYKKFADIAGSFGLEL